MLKIINVFKSHTSLFLMATLTLGLAPFFPEPHIWGKIKWVLGGAVGMELMDWGDLILHSIPWLLLVISLGLKLKS